MSDLFDTLILLGVVQGGALSLVLLGRGSNRLPNRILSALVAAVALMLLLGYCEMRWGWHGNPHWIAVGSPLPFLFGPLLYSYVAALTRPSSQPRLRHSAHVLPFVAYVLYMAQAFYFESPERKLELVRDYLSGDGAFGARFFDVVQVVQAICYLAASLQLLRRYRAKMQGYFSDLSELDLQWLWRMVLAHSAVWAVVATYQALRALAPGVAWQSLSGAIQLGSAAVIFLTGYVSLWQRDVGADASAAELGLAPAPDSTSLVVPDAEPTGASEAQRTRPKYQRNRLALPEVDELARGLVGCMGEQHAYRDGNLTLQSLADELATTPHALSQVLNVGLGKNFYTFVNGYRVGALKALLRDPSRSEQGVLELGLEVGFNSKSTLNSFFKKATGLTPSEYRRQGSSLEPAGRKTT